MNKVDPCVRELIQEKSFTLMSCASIISITDVQGKIVYANENFTKISGYSTEELIGTKHSIVNSGHHTKSFWAVMWKEIIRGGIWRGEVKNKTKSGNFYWLDSQIMPVKSADGSIVAFLSVRNDLTHQKNQEAAALDELKASELHYKFLYHNTPIMYFTLEPSGNIRSINKFGASQLGYEPEALIGKSVLLVFPAALHQEASNHLAICVAQPNKPFYWEIQKIKADHSLIWVREVAWAETDLHGEVLVTIACQDITEMKTSAEALHTENKLLVEGPTIAFKWKAAEGWPVEFVSSNVASVFGYSASEFISGNILFSAVIHPEDIDRVANEVAAYSASGFDTFIQEYRIITKTGKCRWIKDYTSVVRDERGVVTYYHGHIHDITEPKLAREEILLINARLTSLIESIPDAIFFKDGEGRWLITNEPAKQLFKLHDIDWAGKTELELAELHPEYRTAHEVCIIDDEKAWNEGTLTLFTEFAINDAGDTREYEVRKMPIFNQDGTRRALVIIGTDVTERKHGEAELIRTKEMLEKTMRLAKIGGFEVDFKTSAISWSGLTREFTGVPEDYVPQFNVLINFYKAGESQDKMKRLLKKAIAKGVSFETDVQLVSAKGREYWLRTLHVPKMSNGECIKLSGYFQDITEQVELTKKNQQMERKFSHLIEKSTDAIILQDTQGVILYCSPAIKEILGYTTEEIVGISAYFFFHPDDIAQVEQKRINVLQSPGKHFPLVVDRLKHKKGHYVYVEGSVTNMFDDENVRAAVVNFRDVTEKRSAENKLEMKNERLEQIAWLFSHNVRGPVATILGLLNILNHQDRTDPINEEVLAKILIPAHQLDEIITKIVGKTYEIEEPLMNLTSNMSQSKNS